MTSATFGKKPASAGPASAKPAFGKKTSPTPAFRAQPASQAGLSSNGLAFLESERNRSSVSKAQPAYAAPSQLQAGKPVWGRRIIATLIDAVIFIVPITMVIGAMGPQPDMTDAQFATGYVAVLLFLALGSLAYTIGMESSSLQATLGKMAVGAIVTDKFGGKPSLGAVIMRNTLGKLLSGITPLYLSYLMGLARQDRRCLHDLVAGTMVCAKGRTSASYEQTFA